MLSVSVVTLAPLVLLVDQRTERGFVAIEHKLFEAENSFQLIKIDREASFIHERTHQRVFFG